MTTEQREIVGMVRDFVEREIIPVAHDLDHDDTYPEEIVAQMKQLGFFGFAIPEQYGGAGLDYATYAMVCEEIARVMASKLSLLLPSTATIWSPSFRDWAAGCWSAPAIWATELST